MRTVWEVEFLHTVGFNTWTHSLRRKRRVEMLRAKAEEVSRGLWRRRELFTWKDTAEEESEGQMLVSAVFCFSACHSQWAPLPTAVDAGPLLIAEGPEMKRVWSTRS